MSNCRFETRLCDRGEPGDYARDCGDMLLPAEDSYTAFYVCNNDCSVGQRMECGSKWESAMLASARVSAADWDAYATRLYSASPSQLALLPRIHEVDMVYTALLPLEGVGDADPFEECPFSANHAPFRLWQPHVRHAAYYAPAEPPTTYANNTWVEVTHCSSPIEQQSLWFYVSLREGTRTRKQSLCTASRCGAWCAWRRRTAHSSPHADSLAAAHGMGVAPVHAARQ
eukprot:5318232-Prymnesium_polylepis.1